MESILIGIHVLAAIAITGLVLIQHGKGADMGASFGSGASQTMFGSSGSGNFLTKTTTLLTVIFFATSLGLAIQASQRAARGVQDDSLISSDMQQIQEQQSQQQNNAADSDIPVVEEEAAGDVPTLDAEGDAGTNNPDDSAE